METGAHGLQAAGFTWVLHALPPVYSAREAAGDEMRAVAEAVLDKAGELGLDSVVLPILGAGIFGWPSSGALQHILCGFASWAARSQATPARIVLMDIDEAQAEQAARSIAEFDDLRHQAMGQTLAPKPTCRLVPQPCNIWYWDHRDMLEGWVAYDYDQALQLDRALDAHAPQVMLHGDRLRRPSLSTNRVGDQAFATYEVDFTQSGEDHCAMQLNQKSGYQRKVKREALCSLEEALQKVPVFKEEYEKAQTDYQEALQEWEENHGSLSGAADAGAASQRLPASATSPLGSGAPSRVFSQLPVVDVVKVLVIGLPGEAGLAKGKLQAELAAAERRSKPHALGLAPLETEEDALASLRDFLDRCGLVEVELEPDHGQLVLKALGDVSLLKAEQGLHEWKHQRALKELEDRAQRDQVRYPGSGADTVPCQVCGRSHSQDWFRWPPLGKEEANTPGARFDAVDPDSEEYGSVVRLMRDETGLGQQSNVWRKRILRVERVVNPVLWAGYHFRCERISRINRNRGCANELWVKHGTGRVDPKKICEGEAGIHFNYSSDNCMFGRGTYTAENACYCDDNGYCYSCPDGSRQILLCRLTAGTVSEMAYGEESRKLKEAPDGFDSVRGDVLPGRGFFALMVYSSEQTYPAYLVTFQP